MENYVGKTCPFCKTEIKEGDGVKVCPACNIPHHDGCWEENKGCTTFGCSEQHYEEKGTNPIAACNNCGATLGAGQEFCSKCGQKVGMAVDTNVNTAISQFNTGIEKKKAKSKALPIVIAVVLVVVAALGFFISKTIGEKKAEEARKEYIENVEDFLTLSITAGANLEDIADTVQKYWYENIWEDKHGADIDTAILLALIDKSDEIDQAGEYDTQMKDLYSELKKVPEHISEEDLDEIEDLCDAVKDLYNVYTEFYSLATDPSGNYNSYSDNNNEITDEFLACYRALENLLD